MKIPGLTINEAMYKLEDNSDGKIAVFLYAGSRDPKQILDRAVQEYVGNNPYHELIESNLNNPWMRVIVSNINSMHQESYDSLKYKLK